MTTTTCSLTADTYLDSGHTTSNYGNLDYFYVGRQSSLYRPLIKFDLSTIPSLEICDSAVMSLWPYDKQADQDSTWNLHRLLRNWGELTATYNKYDGTNVWGTAGATGAGDIDSTPMGTLSVAYNKAYGEWQISFDPVEFQKMYDGVYTNYGWLILSTEPQTSLWKVHSKEYATAAERPKLVVVTHAGEARVMWM